MKEANLKLFPGVKEDSWNSSLTDRGIETSEKGEKKLENLMAEINFIVINAVPF
jgi:hypothetical protein